MKPGFSLRISARPLGLGLLFLCLSGFAASGTLKAAEVQTNAPAPSASELLNQTMIPLGQTDTGQLPWLVPYVEGNPNAPFQITLYLTPFCPDCATSYMVDHPIMQKYIDQNLLRVRYQDVSFDEPTRRSVAFLHCLPRDHYLDNLNSLYILRTSSRATPGVVKKWADGLVKKYGLTEEFMEKCMNDQRLLQSRDRTLRFAHTYLGIRLVPAYLFGKSQFRLSSHNTPDEFDALLQKMTADLKPAPEVPGQQPAQAAPEQPGQ